MVVSTRSGITVPSVPALSHHLFGGDGTLFLSWYQRFTLCCPICPIKKEKIEKGGVFGMMGGSCGVVAVEIRWYVEKTHF